MLINNATYQRETLSVRPIRQPLIKGYCTPDQICDCLCIFLKNFNTLHGDKKDMLITGYIPRNPHTALGFPLTQVIIN